MTAPIPFVAETPTLSISASSSPSTSINIPGIGPVIRIVNEGPNIAFISIGVGAQIATLPDAATPLRTSTPVLGGSDIVLSIPFGAQHQISAICRSTQTAVLSIQVGDGL